MYCRYCGDQLTHKSNNFCSNCSKPVNNNDNTIHNQGIRNFTDDLNSMVKSFRQQFNRYRNLYYICQIVILVASAATPLANAFSSDKNDIQYIKLYTTGFAIASALGIGILQ